MLVSWLLGNIGQVQTCLQLLNFLNKTFFYTFQQMQQKNNSNLLNSNSSSNSNKQYLYMPQITYYNFTNKQHYSHSLYALKTALCGSWMMNSSWYHKYVNTINTICDLKPTKITKSYRFTVWQWQICSTFVSKITQSLTQATYFQFKTAFEVDVANVLALHQLQLCISVLRNVALTLVLTILLCTYMTDTIFIHLKKKHNILNRCSSFFCHQ